jgi:hypothetical protein
MKIELISSFFRGRLTISELMDMSLSKINCLYRIAEQKSKSEAGKKQMSSEVIEDEMEAMM